MALAVEPVGGDGYCGPWISAASCGNRCRCLSAVVQHTKNPVTRAAGCRYNTPVLEVGPGMAIKTSGEGVAQASGSVLSDYVVLLKTRVMSLVVFTGFAGMIVAPDEAHPLRAAAAVLCIALGAGAAAVINRGCARDPEGFRARPPKGPD